MQVAHLYGWEMERPDRALLRSGFVAAAAAPPLCGVDFPGGDPDAFVAGPEFGRGPGEPHATRAELARLEAILASFPTSEVQDARILAGARPAPAGRGRAAGDSRRRSRLGDAAESARRRSGRTDGFRMRSLSQWPNAAWRPCVSAHVRLLFLHCVHSQARAPRTSAPRTRAKHARPLTLP